MNIHQLTEISRQISIRLGDLSLANEVLSVLVEIVLTDPEYDLSPESIPSLTTRIAKSILVNISLVEVPDSSFDKDDTGFSVINVTPSDKLNPEEALSEMQDPTPEPCMIEADPYDDPLLSWDEEQLGITRFILGMKWRELDLQIGQSRSTLWKRIKRMESNVRPSESNGLIDEMVEINWLEI